MLTWLFALVIGVALGMLGGGGSILTVPVFTYIAGLEPKVAIAASLPMIALISAFGAFGHWRAGHVQLRTAGIFGAFTMVGGFSGARASQWMSAGSQMLLFAVVMMLAALSMLRDRRAPVTADDAPHSLPLLKVAPLGIAVGVLTGLVGVGGGFLIVPALVQIGRVPMRAAVGTSLLVIAMNGTASTLGYVGQLPLPLGLLIPFTGIALVGIAVGTTAAQRVPQATLRRAFAVLLLVVGGFVLYKNRDVLAAATHTASHDSRAHLIVEA